MEFIKIKLKGQSTVLRNVMEFIKIKLKGQFYALSKSKTITFFNFNVKYIQLNKYLHTR